MEKAELKEKIENLVANQLLAVLSSVARDGSPYSNIVGFVVSDDLREIAFATPKKTRKYQNIEHEPRVSLLIDSRSNRDSDFHDAAAVTVLGVATELTGEDRDRYAEVYLKKHPHLEVFIKSPTCALMLVTVHKYCHVNRFQNVYELEISQ